MTNKINYNTELLNKLSIDNNVNINYTDTKITRNSKITFNCIGCSSVHTKSFRSIVINGGFNCSKCSRIVGQEKLKNTNLEKYGVTCVLNNKDIIDKIKITNINKYGVDNLFKLESVQEKIREKNKNRPRKTKPIKIKEKIPVEISVKKRRDTILEKYGVDHYSKTDEYRKKFIETSIKKYGVSHPSKSNDVQNKLKNTNLEKYGVTCVLNNKDIIDKIKKTNINKYGFEYAWQNSKILDRVKNTILEKYGVTHFSKTPEFLEKTKKTNITKFGYESYLQNPILMEKVSKKQYKSKAITTPSGNTIYLQGYEPQAYNILLGKYNENEIITNKKDVPEIWWTDSSNNRHRYYTDFYIPKENLCIEVKSKRTYNIDSGKTEKINKCIETIPNIYNYNYEIWILDINGNILDKQIYHKK